MAKYRYVGTHAEEFPKGDKRVMLGMGDFIDLTTDEQKEESVKERIDNGMLVAVTELKGKEG